MYADEIFNKDGLRITICGEIEGSGDVCDETVTVAPDPDALPELVKTIVRWCDENDMSHDVAFALFKRSEEKRLNDA